MFLTSGLYQAKVKKQGCSNSSQTRTAANNFRPLQRILLTSLSARVVVIPVEATLPREEESEKGTKTISATKTTREELYNSIGKNARLNRTYLLLIFLSTVVVAIGLLKDNVAVVIGAMVIAPLLGLNLAMASGAAAVISLTSGIPSILVGVMVAVALLPRLQPWG